jgi:hypothetical protein
MHTRSVFTFADSSHQGPCICKGDWYGSSESGSPRIPTRHTQDQHVLSTFHFHTNSFTLTCRHLMMKALKLSIMESQLLLTDDNGKCFHLSRVLMVPKLQKWWNVEEKFLWPNRDSNPGTLKWKSVVYPLHHQNPFNYLKLILKKANFQNQHR